MHLKNSNIRFRKRKRRRNIGAATSPPRVSRRIRLSMQSIIIGPLLLREREQHRARSRVSRPRIISHGVVCREKPSASPLFRTVAVDVSPPSAFHFGESSLLSQAEEEGKTVRSR